MIVSIIYTYLMISVFFGSMFTLIVMDLFYKNPKSLHPDTYKLLNRIYNKRKHTV